VIAGLAVTFTEGAALFEATIFEPTLDGPNDEEVVAVGVIPLDDEGGEG
jgi:hypothetical protein